MQTTPDFVIAPVDWVGIWILPDMEAGVPSEKLEKLHGLGLYRYLSELLEEDESG